MPTKITYSSGKSAAYIYDATGRKLQTSYKASASATAVPTDYCGNMIYENGVLKQVLVDGGYMTVTGTPFYFYYLKDHLGSNRVVVSPAGTATQINHYYPFGGLFGESTGGTSQRFKYNGKEFDRTHGLDWYDYGARHMSPDVGRFTTIDPMAENYYSISPYAYCGNNPMKYIDPNGMDWIHANYNGEQFVYFDDRINSQEDIDKYYYGNNESHSIKYLGKSGNVYQGTKDGDKLSYILNSDGTYSDSYGNMLLQEVSIGDKLHIGSSVIQLNEQQKNNFYGFYLGPNNPNNGNIDLYSIPPIDRLDYAAYRHDKGYDSKNVAGFVGVFYNSSNYGDDWNLAVKALNEVLSSTVGTTKWGWALGTSTLFGTLAVLKKINELRK